MQSRKQFAWWLTSALVALFILPLSGFAEQDGIGSWGVNDATYGLKTREAEAGFSYTPSPADWRDINIYQLFTDRFADSGTDQLASYKAAWKTEGKSFPQNRNFHHGGDWKGMKNNIPYLSGMGVKAVWISGVQQNDQGKDTNYTPYHQYHPDNFFKCDPAMGTFAELKELIDALHAAGIYVILDVAPNHMCDKNGLWGNSQNDDKQYWSNGNGTFGWWNDGNKHPAPFDNLNYFHNNGTINCWDCSPENLLGQFKGTDDLKTEDSAVQSILSKAFKNLIDATDCDGFRVDAIKHMEYNWNKQWADDMRKHAASRGKNDFILFGELFSYDNGALSSWCKDAGYSYNSALFFPLSQNIKSVFVDGSNPNQLTQQLNNKGMYGEGANRLVAFIDNHDLNRIALMNGGDTGNDVWKLRPALSFLYLATPVPCLYYGTEHAFDQGGHYNGSNKTQDNPDDGDWQRECMFDKGFQPGPAQGNKLTATDAPLYQHIKALNAARAVYKSLTRGSFTERWTDGAYAFSRVYDTEESLVAINLGDGSKSLDPQVGKPDGTQFVNALNSADKVTSAGGRISITLSGKETKVYVSGIAAPEMWVKGTHASPADGTATSADPIFINTEAGPTGVVASAKVGYSADGGTTWNVLAMTATNWASTGGSWYFARLGAYPAGTVIKYYIEIADTNSPSNKKWDNNGGGNYTLTVKQAAGVWARNSKNYPIDGEATDATDLYLNSEAGPSGQVTSVTASYSTNGTTWKTTNLALKADWGSDGGNWYEANLGKFPADAVVKYYVTATGATSTNKDDNGGQNFQVTIRSSVVDTLWVGDTRWTPANGEITPASTIQITCESWPKTAATNVAMAYSIDGGASWQQAALSSVGSNPNNDIWQRVMGPYPNGTTLRFAVVAQSGTKTNWDNNGGQDYRAIVGEVGGLRMVEHTPVINAGGSPDNAGDQFDFATTGGAATTGGTNGFGSFGSVYVNFDAGNLYVGGTGVDLPHDSVNNAYIVFLSGGTNAGSGNFWNFGGLPEGLDYLHNTAYQPPVSMAILLGDVWGDGTFTNFGMYTNPAFNFGQGVFATPAGGTAFAPVAGTQLSQFGGYGPDNRLAANWECAIPLARFGVTNASQLTNLYLSGLMVTSSTSNNNRFISGKYLGDSAALGNGEQPDEWGNFAFSFVNLGGTKVLPPASGSGDLGVPPAWVSSNLPPSYVLTTNSNHDGDQHSDRNEYFAGLDPAVADDLDIEQLGGGQIKVRKAGSQACTYVLDVADRVENGGWNWAPRGSFQSLDGAFTLPILDQSNAMMRVRVNVPPVDQPVDSVNVAANPPGGSFSTTNVNVTLGVSGVNVTSSTYTVQGGSATAYSNGQVLVFGAGMTNGQTRTLTLAGSTVSGVSTQKVYTFTKTAANVAISWTGLVGTDPASGAWDTNEALTISFQTAPIGAAVSAGVVFSANGGSTWSNTNMTKGAANASNDIWSVNLGAYPAGTVVQFALEAKDSQNNSTWNNNNNNNYSISVNGGGTPGGSKPYSTNPTKGQYRSAGITIDGANTGGEWTSSMLIALDKANDDPRTLGSNWTTHEAPIDFTHLWACWDDNNVYLAWQLVDITDVIDGTNAGGGDPINRNDGILMWMVLDTKTGGATGDMWTKSNTWSGANTPDFQVYMAGSLWQSYMGRAVGTAYNVPSGGATNADYKTGAGWGITHAKSASLVAADVWGVNDCDDRGGPESGLRDFKTTGHARTDRDSFYEIKIPLTSLGITKTQLESQGIAVMLGAGSLSAMDTIPNSAGNTDTGGVETWNSSKEWSDSDVYTEPFARIGN